MKQINCCPCGNQEIARSGSSAATILFCPDCGRFVETKTLRQAVALWNSSAQKRDEDTYILTDNRLQSAS